MQYNTKYWTVKFLNTIEENVVCKLINQTLLLDDKIPDEKMLEMAFLKA